LSAWNITDDSPGEGRKRRRRRRSGQDETDDDVYSEEESEEENDSSGDEKYADLQICWRKGQRKEEQAEKATTLGQAFRTIILYVTYNRPVESRRRKKRKSAANENPEESAPIDTKQDSTPKKAPELGDGWTNIEWTILEHTHDHIRNLGEEDPEKVDPTKLAEEFLKLYAKSDLKLQAEREGKVMKEFSKEEVRDRIIALRQTRDRRRSGELPSPGKLLSPASIKSIENIKRRVSGFLAKLW
jgi:hypothetical protein